MMVGKTKAATKAQKRRMDEIFRIGCIACHVYGVGFRYPQIHHITRAGRRLGHDYTIPLCPWHHMGIPHMHTNAEIMEQELGPSLARNKRRFIEVYGTELELLERVDNLREKHGTH